MEVIKIFPSLNTALAVMIYYYDSYKINGSFSITEVINDVFIV